MREAFIRTISKNHRSYLTREQKRKNKSNALGRITHIPSEYIGFQCLVVPITKSQAQYFIEKTKGYERSLRYVKQVLKNPRIMLDKL